MIGIILVVLLIHQVSSEIDLTVVTAKGPVKGQRASDGNFTTFFGIPYAKVDEDNPFGNSLEYPNFETPFEASENTLKCPQLYADSNAVLQCLTLNIYVPNTVDINAPLPVFVWIHGGAFSFGSRIEYGGKYLVQHDIIVVTINYRVGPYGFLCLNDPSVPGNQGLKDQVAALRWIKANIGAFGGNSDEVTIAGESAGAGSVDLHIYSLYETLFNKAIIESGSIFVEGMFVKADHLAAIKIAEELGYTTTHTSEALKFLTSVDHTQVVTAFNNLGLELRPCQEKRFKGVQNFVVNDPYHLLTNRIKNVSILIGYNSKEEFSRFASESEEYFENLGPYFYNTLKKNYNFKEYELVKLARIIRRFYMGSKPISKASFLELCDFYSDFMMNRAAEMSLNKYINQGAEEVYKYLFSYIGDTYENVTDAGASHTDELRYIFEMEPLETDEDLVIRDRMTMMWANFVKYGNPTPETSDLLPVKWEPVTRDSFAKPYLNIDVDMEMLDSVYNERIQFWELFNTAYWKQSVLVRTPKRF